MDANLKAELVELIHALGDAAKAETLRHFRGGALETVSKQSGGYDPVTIADRAAEAAIREVLASKRSDDAILGEEYGAQEGTSGLTWVLDPIDGTRGYVAGTPTWGTLIALHDGQKPVLGLIDQPYIGERFIGGLGQAGFSGPHGTADLQVSTTKALSEATIFTTFPEMGAPHAAEAFQRVAGRCKLTRYGMDCYAYALLALGQIDLVVEYGLQAYDIQAPIAVVEAAGGIVTNWEGGAADQGGSVLAAATPELHAVALEALHG